MVQGSILPYCVIFFTPILNIKYISCQQNVSHYGFCESKAEPGTEDVSHTRSWLRLRFVPSHDDNLEELTFEEVQKRFVRKILEMDGQRQQTRWGKLLDILTSTSLRSIHEAYQFLVLRKKKMTGRSMQVKGLEFINKVIHPCFSLRITGKLEDASLLVWLSWGKLQILGSLFSLQIQFKALGAVK